jgi:hypothetical protein
MTREYIERQPGWVGTFRCLRNGTFACLMKTPTGHWYWSYPDYQGLFPYGATGLFDTAFLQDALSRRVLEPVASSSALPQKWA